MQPFDRQMISEVNSSIVDGGVDISRQGNRSAPLYIYVCTYGHEQDEMRPAFEVE